MASAFALSWESVNSDSLGTGYYFITFQKKSNFFKREENPTGDVNSYFGALDTKVRGEKLVAFSNFNGK